MFSNQNRCEYHAAPIKQFRFSSFGQCDIGFSYQNVGVDRRVLRLCRNPGLNQGPLDLQSNALPTELFRPTRYQGPAHHLAIDWLTYSGTCRIQTSWLLGSISQGSAFPKQRHFITTEKPCTWRSFLMSPGIGFESSPTVHATKI